MRRRKTGRDGFQGWSPSSAAAWDRIFGGRPTEPPVSGARFWEPSPKELHEMSQAELQAYSLKQRQDFKFEAGASADGPYIIAQGDLLKEVWD